MHSAPEMEEIKKLIKSSENIEDIKYFSNFLIFDPRAKTLKSLYEISALSRIEKVKEFLGLIK